MTQAKAFAQGAYGAFELKRCYQKNMFTGTIVSGLIPLVIFLCFVIAGLLSPAEVPVPTKDRVIKIGPPPPPTAFKPVKKRIYAKPKEFTPPQFAVPRPVEDDAIETVNVLATINQKVLVDKNNIPDNPGVYSDPDAEYAGIVEELIPPPDTFIPRTQNPHLVTAPQPKYPEMARQAGIEGHVWVQIYVDAEGNVIKAEIQKPSGANAGFEEAALAAAWGRIYRPAMQNDQPVGVWISYKVTFKLH